MASFETTLPEWTEAFQKFILRIADAIAEKSTKTTDEVLKSCQVWQHEGNQNLQAILDKVDSLFKVFIQSDSHEQRTLSDATHLSLLAQSLGGYLFTLLTPNQSLTLSKEIDTITSEWIKQLLKLPSTGSGYFGIDDAPARVFVGKAALNNAFGTPYISQGYISLELQPRIYISADIAHIGERLCLGLGFPRSSLKLVDVQGATNTLDTSNLIEAITQDIEFGFKPFMVIASADLHHIDDITSIRKICTEHGVWLHLEGDAISLLAHSSLPEKVAAFNQCDSLTIHISKWFGMGTRTFWTFITKAISSSIHNDYVSSHVMTSFPVWFYLQRTGKLAFVKSIEKAYSLQQYFLSALRSVENIIASEQNYPAILFRYAPDALSETHHVLLLNKLNEQILYDITEVVNVPLTLHTENGFNFICFQPLLSPHVSSLTESQMDSIVKLLNTELTMIDSTLNHREKFSESIAKLDGLRSVPTGNFIGLGAVRYTPAFLASQKNLADDVRQEIDSLNATLAAKLNEIDEVFSEGKSVDGDTCVFVGVNTEVVNADKAEEVAKLIHKTAVQLQLSAKLVEKIAEIVRKGIQAAEAELTKEEEDILYQEGIIRQLPVVGSVWNWFSPFEKPTPHGRTFDLASKSLMKSPSLENSVSKKQPGEISDSSNNSPRMSRRSNDSLRNSVDSQTQNQNQNGQPTEISQETNAN